MWIGSYTPFDKEAQTKPQQERKLTNEATSDSLLQNANASNNREEIHETKESNTIDSNENLTIGDSVQVDGGMTYDEEYLGE